MNHDPAAILIVDDNPANLSLLFDMLDEAGFEVLVSQNGESALQRAAHTQPDIILLDVMMPGLNGFETCQRLKADEQTREIPVIFMTAVTSTDEKTKGFELGAVDYITKPIQPHEVLARVKTHLTLRALQRDLEQKNVELAGLLEREKELNSLKSRFISMASHEFKTPLTTIALSCNLLQRYSDRMPPEKRQEELQVIMRTVEYMSELLENVLVISRHEAGKIAFHPEPLDVLAFCQRLIERFQAMHEATHTLSFSGRVQHEQLLLDAKLLEHILSNLLTNAVKYSPDGGQVTLTVTEDNESISFCVEDQGIGMSAADQRLLGESFHRGENVGNIKGTGLGLFIVKQFVELHSGSLQVHSKLKAGATVTVSLPAHSAAG
jgi:two-component system, sensor histidine kinase and response regulator